MSESDLLLALRAGHPGAFEEFVRRHGDAMYAVARRILGNEEDAGDALQDAFFQAFRAIHQFDGRSQLSTWLHRIVINASLKKRRLARRGHEHSIEALLPHFVEGEHHAIEPIRWGSTVEELASRNELRELVQRRIDELPESYRTVILLRDIEGLNTEETAQILGTTIIVVKTRLHRARQALRTLLEPDLQGGGHELP